MSVASIPPPWLLLVFSLPSRRASERVEVWRKLQRYGALPLRSSGYVLPSTPANQEKLEWLATAIRNYKGQASLVQVQSFDDLPDKKIGQLFTEARASDYEKLLRELKSTARQPAGRLSRMRKRFQEIAAIDFFENPLRARVEAALARADEPQTAKPGAKAKLAQYRNRIWITRPRPGIDRVASAWLVRRFIDPKARFVFGDEPEASSEAIPFDMFAPTGFNHRKKDCTFETLCKEFAKSKDKAWIEF